MSITKLDLLDTIIGTVASCGVIAVILGSGSCLGGLTATGIIKAGEFLSSNRPTYQKMMFYGAVGSGAGLFLIGAGAALGGVRDRVAEEELRRIDARIEAVKAESEKQRSRLSGCQGCKYWHGRSYEGKFLACAVHPDGNENCPDWEELL